MMVDRGDCTFVTKVSILCFAKVFLFGGRFFVHSIYCSLGSNLCTFGLPFVSL